MIARFDFAAVRKARGFWYLGTPYTRYPHGTDRAFTDAALVAAALTRLGITVYSPIVHSHPIAAEGGLDPLDARFWMRTHRPVMNAAAGLIVAKLDGWHDSDGLAAEIGAFALEGKPIEYLSPVELRQAVVEAKARLAAFQRVFLSADGFGEWRPA